MMNIRNYYDIGTKAERYLVCEMLLAGKSSYQILCALRVKRADDATYYVPEDRAFRSSDADIMEITTLLKDDFYINNVQY